MGKIDVLIVDDNKEFCQLLADFFDMSGEINVLETLNNGEQALSYLKENKSPDVLILDLIMPHLDGIGVLEEIKSSDSIAEMKIITLTAMGHDEIMKTVIELGVHYYIMKPFDLDKLLLRVKQLINDKQIDTEGICCSDTAAEEAAEDNYLVLITSIMHEMGIPAHIKGYHYLRYAVELVINDIDLLGAVTKKLYPEVAEKFDSTPSRVERAIRHAIEVVWDRGNKKAVEKYFSNNSSENYKPTNSQLIARIADEIRVELKVS